MTHPSKGTLANATCHIFGMMFCLIHQNLCVNRPTLQNNSYFICNNTGIPSDITSPVEHPRTKIIAVNAMAISSAIVKVVAFHLPYIAYNLRTK